MRRRSGLALADHQAVGKAVVGQSLGSSLLGRACELDRALESDRILLCGLLSQRLESEMQIGRAHV